MVSCFTVAGYLINDSYSDWLESPVATIITTKPLSDLDFPTVTVCPPKDSNTALNYDLMKADNNSLTQEDREWLKQEVLEIFLKHDHYDNINTILSIINEENTGKLVKGFQSYPRPYKGT